MTVGATLQLLAFAAALVGLYAVFWEPRRLRRTEVEVPIDGLPRAFEGYTMAVLTDIHYGGMPGFGHFRRTAAMARAARPDVLLLLGDYGQSIRFSYAMSRRLYRRAFPRLTAMLRAVDAPDGMIAVIGNHDYYYNGPAVAEWLRSIGARVLINEHVVLERDGQRLVIGGMDDVTEGRPDPLAGLADAPPDAPRIVLAHDPDGALHLDPAARAQLVLSGHTHGGQVVLPFYGAPITPSRVCDRHHARGWIPGAPVPLFVSAGIGSQASLRFLCPPEVVIVRLRGRDSGLGTRDSGELD